MTLTWKQRLQQASYRGVAFLVSSHDLETGRRGSVQEFPQRDDPYVEDLGRRAKRFRIQAILLGDDYMDRRDKLVKVCTSRGLGFPKKVGGILRHPYLGDVRVFCLSIRVRESIPDGRMARVDLEFVEAGEAPEPLKATSAAEEQTTAAAAASTQSEAFATDEMDSVGPESVRDAIAGELKKLGDKLAVLDVFTGPALEVALLAGDIDDLITDATALAKAPADAAAKVRQAIGRVKGAVARTADAIFAYEALFGLEADQIGGKGGTGTQADANALAIVNQIRETSVAELAAALAKNAWESRDDALEHRADLILKIEAVMDTGDPDLQIRLSRILSLAGATIPPTDQRLPRLLSLTLRADTPSLVLAYQVYDNADRDQEVADRAPAPRPGFIPGGVPIEVLTDA